MAKRIFFERWGFSISGAAGFSFSAPPLPPNIRGAAVNVVSKDGAVVPTRDCELVFVVSPPARWERDPDTNIPQGCLWDRPRCPEAPSDHDIDFEMEAS